MPAAGWGRRLGLCRGASAAGGAGGARRQLRGRSCRAGAAFLSASLSVTGSDEGRSGSTATGGVAAVSWRVRRRSSPARCVCSEAARAGAGARSGRDTRHSVPQPPTTSAPPLSMLSPSRVAKRCCASQRNIFAPATASSDADDEQREQIETDRRRVRCRRRTPEMLRRRSVRGRIARRAAPSRAGSRAAPRCRR